MNLKKITDSIRSFFTSNALWAEVIAALVMVAIFSFLVSSKAHKRRDELKAESQRLSTIRDGVQRWQSSFQTATPEENVDWELVRDSLTMLGVKPIERLTLAQLIAQRAEDAGANNVRVTFTTVEAPGSITRGIGKWSFANTTYGFSLQMSGDVEAALRAINTLPLSIEVTSIDIKRGSGGIGATTSVALTVYEPTAAGG